MKTRSNQDDGTSAVREFNLESLAAANTHLVFLPLNLLEALHALLEAKMSKVKEIKSRHASFLILETFFKSA